MQPSTPWLTCRWRVQCPETEPAVPCPQGTTSHRTPSFSSTTGSSPRGRGLGDHGAHAGRNQKEVTQPQFMDTLLEYSTVPHSGKFSKVLIFVVFEDQGETAKFNNTYLYHVLVSSTASAQGRSSKSQDPTSAKIATLISFPLYGMCTTSFYTYMYARHSTWQSRLLTVNHTHPTN